MYGFTSTWMQQSKTDGLRLTSEIPKTVHLASERARATWATSPRPSLDTDLGGPIRPRILTRSPPAFDAMDVCHTLSNRRPFFCGKLGEPGPETGKPRRHRRKPALWRW